jgi:hypothetical protein
MLQLRTICYGNRLTGLRGGHRKVTAPEITGGKQIYTNQILPRNSVDQSRKNPSVTLALLLPDGFYIFSFMYLLAKVPVRCNGPKIN